MLLLLLWLCPFLCINGYHTFDCWQERENSPLDCWWYAPKHASRSPSLISGRKSRQLLSWTSLVEDMMSMWCSPDKKSLIQSYIWLCHLSLLLQVLLVSAQDALLSRLILSGKASDEERQRFARKAFGRALRNRSEADYRAEAALMLEESHMPELEDCLLGYLYNHAGSLKIVSLLDGIAKLLTQVYSSTLNTACVIPNLFELFDHCRMPTTWSPKHWASLPWYWSASNVKI